MARSAAWEEGNEVPGSGSRESGQASPRVYYSYKARAGLLARGLGTRPGGC